MIESVTPDKEVVTVSVTIDATTTPSSDTPVTVVTKDAAMSVARIRRQEKRKQLSSPEFHAGHPWGSLDTDVTEDHVTGHLWAHGHSSRTNTLRRCMNVDISVTGLTHASSVSTGSSVSGISNGVSSMCGPRTRKKRLVLGKLTQRSWPVMEKNKSSDR